MPTRSSASNSGNIDTSTPTSFTEGSVIFAGSDGTLQEDNTCLFYDDTNNRLRLCETTSLGEGITWQNSGGVEFASKQGYDAPGVDASLLFWNANRIWSGSAWSAHGFAAREGSTLQVRNDEFRFAWFPASSNTPTINFNWDGSLSELEMTGGANTLGFKLTQTAGSGGTNSMTVGHRTSASVSQIAMFNSGASGRPDGSILSLYPKSSNSGDATNPTATTFNGWQLSGGFQMFSTDFIGDSTNWQSMNMFSDADWEHAFISRAAGSMKWLPWTMGFETSSTPNTAYYSKFRMYPTRLASGNQHAGAIEIGGSYLDFTTLHTMASSDRSRLVVQNNHGTSHSSTIMHIDDDTGAGGSAANDLGDALYELGNDFAKTGAQTYYLWDSKAGKLAWYVDANRNFMFGTRLVGTAPTTVTDSNISYGNLIPGTGANALGSTSARWFWIWGASMTLTNNLYLDNHTLGSVLFIGAADKVEEDNSNFFWDDTNNRLGIGTNSPASKLTCQAGSSGVSAGTELPFKSIRYHSNTIGLGDVTRLVFQSTGNMADTFGPAHIFYIADNANVENRIGILAYERANSSDTTGNFLNYVYNAGVAKLGHKIDYLGDSYFGGEANPETDSTYDLGTTSLRWNKLWVDDITATDNIHSNSRYLDGVVADDSTDNSTVIQAEIDRLELLDGGDIYLPDGICQIDSTLVMNGNNVRLHGTGGDRNHNTESQGVAAGTTLRWNGAEGGIMISILSVTGTYKKYGNGVTNLHFDGKNEAATYAGEGIRITSHNAGVFHHLNFVFIRDYGIHMTTDATVTETPDNQHNFFQAISGRSVLNTAPLFRLTGAAGSNTSFNTFQDIHYVYDDGNAIEFGNSDENYFYGLGLPRTGAGTGNGVVFEGSNDALNRVSRKNVIFRISGVGPIVMEGTGDKTHAAYDNTVLFIDTGNGTPLPTLGTGATGSWNTDAGNQYQFKGIGAAVGTSVANTAQTLANVDGEALRIGGTASKHLVLENADATASWAININETGDHLRIVGAGSSGDIKTGDNIDTSGNITTTQTGTFGVLDVDSINIQNNDITSSTGTIQFGNDHLETTGDFTADDVDVVGKIYASTVVTQTNGAAPTCGQGNLFVTSGTTTITSLPFGEIGQTIHIKSAHTKTITHNSAIFLAGSVNFDMVAGDTLTLTSFADDVWHETGRMVA